MSPYSHVSVSLGSRALPAVAEAVEHAHAFPEHDPVVSLYVSEDRREQEVHWRCPDCDPVEP